MHHRVLATAVALAIAAVLAACNGDGGTPAPTATPQVSPTPAPPTATDSPQAAELRQLADGWGDRPLRITYRYESTVTGDEETGEFTLLYLERGSWRVDLTADDEQSTVISDGDASYVCDGTECVEAPTEGQFPIPILDFLVNPDEFDRILSDQILGLGVQRSERQIAGEAAICFRAEGVLDGEAGEAEYCFREDGVLLYLHGAGAESGGFTLEATEVGAEVSESDLEPPLPIVTPAADDHDE